MKMKEKDTFFSMSQRVEKCYSKCNSTHFRRFLRFEKKMWKSSGLGTKGRLEFLFGDVCARYSILVGKTRKYARLKPRIAQQFKRLIQRPCFLSIWIERVFLMHASGTGRMP